MNVIVPIHVEALRVSQNTLQTAKPALYDFTLLPNSPMAGGSNQVPAEIFAGGALPLKDGPGIHLHWSIPRSYTQGNQDDGNGNIGFRTLPNRWLITRLIKDITAANADPSGNAISVTSWILESDAHNADPDAVGQSRTTIPWMEDPTNMYGMTFHFSGNRILLDNSWTEPGQGAGYLGDKLQAPFAYGETFTAYYRNCGNIFGMYDNLGDITSSYGQDGSDHTFSVCYVVTGWVSPASNDTCVKILNEALKEYLGMSDKKKPSSFPDYVSGIFEDQLKWTVDCSVLTPDNVGQTRAFLSGTIGSIKWDTQEAHGQHYPFEVPRADNVSLAIGNTPSQALAAFLAAAGNTTGSTPDPGDLASNLEWLLNTLQTGRLSLLGTGEMGVGQLDEYLHTRSFGSKPGGYLWTVRGKMEPKSINPPRQGGEAALPMPLALLLADLNDCQKEYDQLNDEILSRQQKIFFDWNYHIRSIEANVVPKGKGDISNDHSGNYLLDGIMNLLPCFVRTGTTGKITGGTLPYSYSPNSFQIAAPAGLYVNKTTKAGLPQYTFNASVNSNAAVVATQLLDLQFIMSGQITPGLGLLQHQLISALSFLSISQAGGRDASDAMNQANAALQAAQDTAQSLAKSYHTITAAAGGLDDIKTNQVDKCLASLSSFCDPATGVFAQWLPVDTGATVPLAAGNQYNGAMDHTPYSNAASWLANGNFKGIKDLLDQLTGQGDYTPFLFDTQTAAIYLAMAHFWRLSQQSPMCATAYYVQMSQQAVLQALTDARNASTTLGNAIDTWTGNTLNPIGQSLDAIATITIPGIITSLSGGSTSIAGNMTALQTLLTATTGQGANLSVAQLLAAVQGDDWRQVVTAITTAHLLIRERLPLAQQVSILNTYLLNNMGDDFEIANAPADRYWLPTEPVLMMAAKGKDASLLKPVSRNGRASLLPCRTDAQLIQSANSITLPAGLDKLATQLDDPAFTGLGTLLQGLATEGLLLWPESNADDQTVLAQAWQQNMKDQSSQLHQVTLDKPPQGFSGLLPYYIAYNRMPDGESFLPLFMLWKVEYVHSNKVDFGKERLASDFLNAFSVDHYGADYQPLAASAGDFQINLSSPNTFTISGVIPLSSASTANLCEEIRRYSNSTLDYDPSKGPPAATDKDADLKNEFYQSWSMGKTGNFLSQTLSGFNAGMVQRAQDLQVPVNIPSIWFNKDSPLQKSSFWPSQMLHDQSVGWPSAWTSEAIDESAFAESKNATYFSPMRAGFLKIIDIQLIDVFGRWVRVPPDAPATIAESLQSQVTCADHQIYLPPRLIQPTRLLFKWVANDAQGIGTFTDWNSHPAADPVLGWLLPNHLDDSLMFYNSEGLSIGEIRSLDTNGLRWFTTPGEPYDPLTQNRQLMDSDLDAKNKSQFFRSFMDTFVYPSSANPAPNFRQLLAVIESARQFVITKSMQQDAALAVLIGQPLVLVRAVLQLECKGLPYTSLDMQTYPRWDEDGPQFTLDDGVFIPYDFANFNDGGIGALQVPVNIGAVDYAKGDQPVVFFDDGLVGYFVNDDYSTFYTPVDLTSVHLASRTMEQGPVIISTYNSATQPVSLTPGGGPATITMLMDPRASVHACSSILPVNQINLPPGQYAHALNRLMISFLAAPLLKTSAGMKIPLPAETGYGWKWWQIGLSDALPLKPSQNHANAFFTGNPQMIVDGWLRLTKTNK